MPSDPEKRKEQQRARREAAATLARNDADTDAAIWAIIKQDLKQASIDEQQAGLDFFATQRDLAFYAEQREVAELEAAIAESLNVTPATTPAKRPRAPEEEDDDD